MSIENEHYLNYKNCEESFFNIQIKDNALMTKQELAIFLNISVKTIDKKVHLKDIPFMKIGRLVRFSRCEILAWAKGDQL